MILGAVFAGVGVLLLMVPQALVGAGRLRLLPPPGVSAQDARRSARVAAGILLLVGVSLLIANG